MTYPALTRHSGFNLRFRSTRDSPGWTSHPGRRWSPEVRVLVIAAHMDDETVGMGGTIAKHVDRGDAVHVCIVCKRAYDHQFKVELVEAERASALRAAAMLGCEPPTFLDLRDELLDERLLDVIVPIERC